MRRPIMAGNWKMFKTPSETATYFEKFIPLVEQSTHCDIVICPPYVDLPAALTATAESQISIGAQNVYWAREGAFTGEISAGMLKELGVQWVIIGHSERRQFFGDTDEDVFKKTVAALDAGLNPIVCVGELLAEREGGETEAVLNRHFRGVSGLTPDQFSQIAIAYEPVWAIGTGKTATPEIAADAHRILRSLVRGQFGAEAANSIRILYGGSVKPDNIKGLMAQPEIDGVLVGGASLDPSSFGSIVNF